MSLANGDGTTQNASLGMKILRGYVVNYTPFGAYVAIKTIFQLPTDFYTGSMIDVEPVTAITMTATSRSP